MAELVLRNWFAEHLYRLRRQGARVRITLYLNAFGIRFAVAKRVMNSAKSARQGEIMSCLIDSTFVRYAAIKTCCSQDSPEPLIIAYSNERSLRELIASPSILGLGFDSRVRP